MILFAGHVFYFYKVDIVKKIFTIFCAVWDCKNVYFVIYYNTINAAVVCRREVI